MPEWLESLFAAVGGGTVVLVGILTVFRGLLVKLFEKGIESSFEKNFEKFKNRLERSTRAYEMLLNHEMRFYDRVDPIIAELIPLIQDLIFYLKDSDDMERLKACEAFRKYFTRYCELIIALKNEILVHQSYVSQEVLSAFTAVVKQMQDDAPYWSDMAKLLFAEEYDKIDYDKGNEKVNALLMQLALSETKVHSRLQDLSGED